MAVTGLEIGAERRLSGDFVRPDIHAVDAEIGADPILRYLHETGQLD